MTDPPQPTPTATKSALGKVEPYTDPSYRPPWWRPRSVTHQVAGTSRSLISQDLPNCDKHWKRTEPELPRRRAPLPSLTDLQSERWRLDMRRCAFHPSAESSIEEWVDLVNEVHHKLHPIFADQYLKQLEGLGTEHPANSEHLSTIVEIEVDPHSGELARIAVPRGSGVALFDSVVLESFLAALPVRLPTALSARGAPLLLRWQIHRLPQYACSTYFADYLVP